MPNGSTEDHSGHDEAVAARQRIDKENAEENTKVPPHTELGDLQELARRIGATQNRHGWLLPFYRGAGKTEMLPLEDWLEQRRVAAEVLRPIEKFEPLGLTQAEVDAKARAERPAMIEGDYRKEMPQSHRGYTEEVDNWAHRSDAMRCRTCMFYVPKARNAKPQPGVPMAELDFGVEVGRCRHSAPTLKGWPAIFPNDWCGAHKLDETKI